MEEQWKTFGENDCYRISSTGKIQSRRIPGGLHKKGLLGEWKDKKQCKGRTDNHGGYYLCTTLWDGKKAKTSRIHRLVAQFFIGEIPKRSEVNHIDGNRENNNVENLEIVSHKKNIRNAWDRGALSNKHKKLHGKVDDMQIITVATMINAGSRNRDIAKYFKADISSISRFRNKKLVYKDFHYLID